MAYVISQRSKQGWLLGDSIFLYLNPMFWSPFFYMPSFKGFTSRKPTHERDGCCGFLNFYITLLLYFILYACEHTCMVCMFVHMCVRACTCMYTYTLYGAHVQVREQFARVPLLCHLDPRVKVGSSCLVASMFIHWFLDGSATLNNGLVLCHYL